MKQKTRQYAFALVLAAPLVLVQRYCDPFVMYTIALVMAGYIGSDIADMIWKEKP